MRWPWTTAKDTAETTEHKREVADVMDRLNVVEERVDLLDEQIAVLQRNGDES